MSPTTLLPWLVVQAASLSQSQVPATGRHETILTLDAPAAVHLSARSGSGTACEVIDRVRGPFARAGVVGRTNCELDLLLDAGQYKVRVESPLKGKGQVALSAAVFTELNPAPSQLATGAVHEATLKPGQQLSFWLPMPTRGVPYVRIAGRHAGDVRLWRNGEWLEPLTLRRTVTTNTPGYPMHEWWIDQVLEAGDYKLVIYGRDTVTVTGSTVDDSLTVERGFRPGPQERSVSFTLPPSGALALELPTSPTVAFASLDSSPDGAVQVQVADLGALAALAFNATCTVPKGALVPECAARSWATPERRVVVVRGPRGTKGTLEWANAVNSDLGWLNSWRGGYYGAPATSFSFSAGVTGRVMVATHDLPIDTDAAPLGCQLEEYDGTKRTGRILARAMTKLEDGEALEKDFNYESGAIIWFELASANRYRIRTDGGRKNRCELYRFKPDGTLERLSQTKNDDSAGCDLLLSLGKGEYQLQLFGGNPGIEKLTVREDSKRELKKAVARSTCQLPPLDLARGSHRLTLTRVGALSARGVSFTEVPVDVTRPVHLALEPRQTLELPLGRGGPFEVRSSGGARFGCRVQGASTPTVVTSCAVPAASAGDGLTLTNPGELPVQVTLLRPVAPPLAAGLSSYAPVLRPLPKLAAEQPAWFDFERNQTNSAMFEVETPGLYNVTTLGLLATSCRLRTPVVDLVAQNAGGGRGRNCLIQTYLQKGRYLLSATTQSLSKGRGALFLLRKPARELPGVSGEGESFFRVDANELVQQKLVVSKSADYRLGTTAQGASLMCRLDDQQGWPIEPVPSACVGTRTLSAGAWLWTQLPLTVESMRRTSLERVREALVLRGSKPHPVQAFTWYDAELGSDGKDEFTFTLEGETTLDVVLTQGMQGRVFVLEKGQPPKAVEVIPPQVTAWDTGGEGEGEYGGEGEAGEGDHGGEPEYSGDGEYSAEGEGSEEPVVASAPSGPALRAAPPPPAGAKVTLPAGSYKLVTEHSKGDVGITYRLHFGSAVLLPGMARSLPVPTTLPLVIPRDGTLRLRTEGEADVRCRLFDERRRLVLEGSENGADWNCALAEPVAKGRYTLVLESETQLGGQTKLSVQLPPVEDQGAFADGQRLSLGNAVLQLTVPPGDTVQELSVRAAAKTPFSCAVVGPEGVAARRSRVTDCSMLVLPKQEPWKLRLWTTDGSANVTTTFKSRAPVTSAVELSATQALSATVSKPGRYRTSPQAFCLRGRATGVFERCGPEVSLEAGPALFAGFGTASVPVPLDEVRFEASATPSPMELSRTVHLQTVTAPQPSLFLLSATSGWGEAAPPSCGFDGAGAVRERRDQACFAVSRLGVEAIARVWAPADSLVPATVVRRGVALPAAPEQLTPGRRKVTFSGVGAFSLPSGRARVEATLPSQTWGVLVDDAGNALELCAPADDLRRCVVTGQGGRFVLVGGSGQAELTTVLLETAPAVVAFTGLYEDTPRAPGTVRLTVPPADQERALLVEGALRCTLVLATGERLADCRVKVPAKTGAELIVEHEVTALRALVHTPGREKWARLGIELPVVAGPALQPAVAVPLQQGRIDRTLVLAQSAVVRVAAESGVCGLFRANDLLAVHGDDTGCELVRVLNPGTYRLLVRPFANRPAPGSLRWLAEPVSTLAEGTGAEVWLAPGEVRLFTFDTRGKGRVGFGVQAKSENLECAVFNDGYQAIGEGCHQYLSLDKGRFLLTVRNPNRPGATPIAVKPVLLGLSGDSNEVPPEYLRDFFGRAGVTP
ncbi:MAG: hypothetical protein JNJ54_09865 [Myxococcaceae bacterium]|nr:hypothetical protein [Myxococcaceae bacterium]